MKKIYKKVLDLSLNKMIEASKDYLDILYLELKIYKIQLENLDKQKPYWFQKKKMKKYYRKRKDIENKISNCQINIEKELTLVSKMIDK